ncbi:unnamed protein product, partial [Mesorhabditis spiculigera]
MTFMTDLAMAPQPATRKRQHSDEVDLSDDDLGSSPKSSTPSMEDDRRAHHNELERRRRDHIKDHFTNLKEAIPQLNGEKSSRALILKRAVEYINALQSNLTQNQRDFEQIKRRNEQLEAKLCQRDVIPVDHLLSYQLSSQIASTSVKQMAQQQQIPAPVPVTPPTVPTSTPLSLLQLPNLTQNELYQLLLNSSPIQQQSPPFTAPVSTHSFNTLMTPNLQLLSLNDQLHRAMVQPY